MQANGLVDLLVQLAACLHFLRREPAAHAFGLQVGMEPVGKLLVFGRITDETGVELDRSPKNGADVNNKLIGKSATSQEYLRNSAVRPTNSVDIDDRRARVSDSFESLSFA